VQHNRVFRILALALIFALLVLPLAATPALAVVTPAITLTPSSGVPGATVTVDGTGFDAYNTMVMYIFFNQNYTGKSATVSNGTFTATITVPTSTTTGIKYITVQYGTPAYEPGNQLAMVTFTVLTCQITISPTAGYVGDTVTANGTGFAANSDVTIYFDTTSVKVATTDASGNLNDATFTVPPSSKGAHPVKGKDPDNESPSVNFSVSQKISITPTGGAPGLPVTVNGSGFAADKTITIKYNAVAVTTTPATVKSDALNGSFSASFIVPSGVAGTYAVEASDGTNSASVNFVVTINVTLSQTTSEASPGYVGMEITFSGTGFKPNTQIRITYTSTTITVATVNSDNEGAFSATFDIPKSEGGTHTIAASDGSNTLQATFFMEQTAPAVPKLLVPASGEEAKSRTVFEWENVTKDVNDDDELSLPVTYDIQIATDDEFSNVVLERTGLTTSGYALLEEEALESTKKEAPYNWRVRAVDAASNVGDWTNPRTFYVSGSDWGLYALIGGGVLVIFFLGFWAGRKTKKSAYY
jgi:hypothetical protein